jgi:hypothetical protein
MFPVLVFASHFRNPCMLADTDSVVHQGGLGQGSLYPHNSGLYWQVCCQEVGQGILSSQWPLLTVLSRVGTGYYVITTVTSTDSSVVHQGGLGQGILSSQWPTVLSIKEGWNRVFYHHNSDLYWQCCPSRRVGTGYSIITTVHGLYWQCCPSRRVRTGYYHHNSGLYWPCCPSRRVGTGYSIITTVASTDSVVHQGGLGQCILSSQQWPLLTVLSIKEGWDRVFYHYNSGLYWQYCPSRRVGTEYSIITIVISTDHSGPSRRVAGTRYSIITTAASTDSDVVHQGGGTGYSIITTVASTDSVVHQGGLGQGILSLQQWPLLTVLSIKEGWNRVFYHNSGLYWQCCPSRRVGTEYSIITTVASSDSVVHQGGLGQGILSSQQCMASTDSVVYQGGLGRGIVSSQQWPLLTVLSNKEGWDRVFYHHNIGLYWQCCPSKEGWDRVFHRHNNSGIYRERLFCKTKLQTMIVWLCLILQWWYVHKIQGNLLWNDKWKEVYK